MRCITILFSYHKEANLLINHSAIKFVRINKYHYKKIFKNLLIQVIIFGQGEKSVKIFFGKYGLNSDIVIKAGTCAIVNSEYQILKSYIPKVLINSSNECCLINVEKCTFLDNLERSTVIDKKNLTIDSKLDDLNKIKTNVNYDIMSVDMEIYYIAKLLIQKNRSIFIPIIVGTDYGNKDCDEDFKVNINKASSILRDGVMEILNKI